MQYGICDLSLVPVRRDPSDTSEMVTQLLYGDHFEVLDFWRNWSKIRIAFDLYEGWIDSKQYFRLTAGDYHALVLAPLSLNHLPFDYSRDKKENPVLIPLGANLSGIHYFDHRFEGEKNNIGNETDVSKTALKYLNAPYLWGGKTPFGIDCSGLVQMVYKLHGHRLLRDASQQAGQGEMVGLEESNIGDLAFFVDSGGKITHVGIILAENAIVHAHGKVRIDYLDHVGILNSVTKKYSHKLKTIRKII